MGVLNVTPDSFSDGGSHESPSAAVAHGLQMLEDGTDIIDVGGESTRPGAATVSLEEEKQRVLPVIEKLSARQAVVSVDTSKPELMSAAALAGAKIINDVQGFTSPQSQQAAADSGCGLVVMHLQGLPATMQDNPRYGDVVAEVRRFLQQQTSQLLAAGVTPEQLCVDPGIGFGKTLEHNLALLNNVPQISRRYPVLLGVSRKSMFASITQGMTAAERDLVSAAAAAILVERGAHILRVHNVAMTRQAIATALLLAPPAANNATV